VDLQVRDASFEQVAIDAARRDERAPEEIALFPD
jgi:hypothetical protein